SGRMSLHQRAFGLKASAEQVVQVLKLTADQAKVALRLGTGPEGFVRGDPDRIGEAIYNLVENAILAAGEGGEAEITLSTKSGLAILGVRDNGHDIPAKDQARIFDLTAVAGAGEPRVDGRLLSLPIVARIVQLHGGRT